MNEPIFVYTTYIHASAAAVWRGLIDPALTGRYWGVELISDWSVGSPLTWKEGDATISDPDQLVLEAEPPRRLAYTWHSFSMDWARTHGFDQELVDLLAAEPRSRVLFEIDEVELRHRAAQIAPEVPEFLCPKYQHNDQQNDQPMPDAE